MSMEHLKADDCLPIRERLDRYVSGELARDESDAVRRHLEGCAQCATAYANRVRIRESLRGAVDSEFAPASLRGSIGRSIREPRRWRISPSVSPSWQRWSVAILTSMLLIVAGFALLKRYVPADRPEIASNAALEQARLLNARTLRIGLGDHIFCAIQHHTADLHETLEQMAHEMGPDYFGLVKLVSQKIPGYEVVVGHQCENEGRRFVHLILRKGDTVGSLAITAKGNDRFSNDRRTFANSADGIPLFQAKVLDGGGFHVSGFETKKYLAFLVSAAPSGEDNLRMASNIASGVDAFLDRL
jgi:hypothetical protein